MFAPVRSLAESHPERKREREKVDKGKTFASLRLASLRSRCYRRRNTFVAFAGVNFYQVCQAATFQLAVRVTRVHSDTCNPLCSARNERVDTACLIRTWKETFFFWRNFPPIEGKFTPKIPLINSTELTLSLRQTFDTYCT